jgi:hypothetical protein
MTFVDLYGTELDRELGNISTQLFTTARRKAAVNWAQLEFVKQTECLKRNTTIPLVSGTQEYDIEATVSDYGFIAKSGISIRITPATGSVRYIEGDNLTRTTVQQLNTERSGWRAESAGTPDSYYVDPNGGAVNLGLVPAPSITAGDTWAVLLPYVVVPSDMSADIDEPFTVSSNPIKWLRLFHRALVHGAAYDLEKFRKEVARSATQLQLFEREIAACVATMTPKGGQTVRLATNYRRSATRPIRRQDPRVWP